MWAGKKNSPIISINSWEKKWNFSISSIETASALPKGIKLKNTLKLLVKNDSVSRIDGRNALSLRRVGYLTWKILQNGDCLLRQHGKS